MLRPNNHFHQETKNSTGCYVLAHSDSLKRPLSRTSVKGSVQICLQSHRYKARFFCSVVCSLFWLADPEVAPANVSGGGGSRGELVIVWEVSSASLL